MKKKKNSFARHSYRERGTFNCVINRIGVERTHSRVFQSFIQSHNSRRKTFLWCFFNSIMTKMNIFLEINWNLRWFSADDFSLLDWFVCLILACSFVLDAFGDICLFMDALCRKLSKLKCCIVSEKCFFGPLCVGNIAQKVKIFRENSCLYKTKWHSKDYCSKLTDLPLYS